MKPPPFAYQAPDTLEEALDLLSQHGDEAKLLAGGQSLVPSMNYRMLQPSMLVDINRIPELDYIRPSDGQAISIGAMTRQRRIETDPSVAERLPLLNGVIPHIAHPQIRNRGTLGGSLAHADPAAELPVICLAKRARFRLQSLTGSRWVSAEDFFLGMFQTALSPQEMLAEVEFQELPEGSGWSFMEFARRHGDYALMGVAVLVQLDESLVCRQARLVYLNAGDGPVDAHQAAELLHGQTPGSEPIEAAAAMAAEEEIDPFGNVHSTVAYQRHLARVLTRRALIQAFERARTSREEEI